MKVTALIIQGADELRWSDDTLFPHIESFINGLVDVFSAESVSLCTDIERVVQFGSGLRCHPCRVEGEKFEQTVHRLSCEMGMEESETWCIVDFHNLYLTPELIRQSLPPAMPPVTPLLSIAPVEDSPYYFERLQRISLGGSLHLFEKEKSSRLGTLPLPADWKVSTPFFFNWEGRVVSPRQGLYACQESPEHLVYREYTPDQSPLPPCLFVCESPRTARIAVPPRKAADCDGITLPQNKAWDCWLKVKELEHKTYVFWVPEPKLSADLQVLPFQETGPLPDFRRAFLLKNGRGCVVFPHDAPPFNGFLATVSHDINSGVPLVKKTFITNGLLWERNRNLQTDQPITGRQLLPEVFSFTGDFVLGRVGQLRNLFTMLENQMVKGVQLPCPPLSVHTRFDLLKYQNKHWGVLRDTG